MKPLQARRYGNGRLAEVKLQRDGRFYAWYSTAGGPHTGARSVSYGSDRRLAATRAASRRFLRDPGYDGVGCGQWQNDHGDDPECVAAMRRETSGSSQSD
jgi:hypothetical protein